MNKMHRIYECLEKSVCMVLMIQTLNIDLTKI